MLRNKLQLRLNVTLLTISVFMWPSGTIWSLPRWSFPTPYFSMSICSLQELHSVFLFVCTVTQMSEFALGSVAVVVNSSGDVCDYNKC